MCSLTCNAIYNVIAFYQGGLDKAASVVCVGNFTVQSWSEIIAKMELIHHCLNCTGICCGGRVEEACVIVMLAFFTKSSVHLFWNTFQIDLNLCLDRKIVV